MLSINNYVRQMLVLLVVTLSLGVNAQVERFVEGVHYTTLPDIAYAKTLDNTTGKVDVVEVFWYGCPHCYEVDPVLESWVDKQAANIDFGRSPLMVWSEINKPHARLYFTALQLGKLEELHSVMFDEIQQRRNPLADEKSAAELFINHGVTAADFTAAYNSFAVDTLLRKAETMQKEIGIPAVPLIIVNGKYMVEGAMLEVVEFLIAKEKAAS
jgi:protein dithiol oxidoreductase (disulfide-forming)